MPTPTSHAMFRQIHRVADELMKISRPQCIDMTPCTTDTLPPIPLPHPQPLYQDLIASGLEPEIATRISDEYIRSASELRQHVQTSMQQALEKRATLHHFHDPQPSTHLQRSVFLAYQKIFLRMTSKWREDAITSAAMRRFPSENIEDSSHSTRSRRDFNYEFVPFLETYFQYNAYPSAPDRAVLARKSMMSPRQIEVWFQNHRNRSKKDGKTLRRLTPGTLPLKLSLEFLEERMPYFMISEHERKEATFLTESESDISDDEFTPTTNPETADFHDIFNTPTPLHAFPATFPPSCHYNPFPAASIFPPLIWMRKPAVSIPHKPPIAFDDFVTAFATKLILCEDRKRQPKRTHRSPWFSATRTIPPSAPHPAFIASTKSAPILPSSRITLPSTPASSALCRNAFVTPALRPPIMLVPDIPQDNSPIPRKVARLPRRALSNTAYRGASPATSEVSPSPSVRYSTSSSRTSSFNSDGTSRGRSPSSSSASSSSYSTPATPCFSPKSLPETVTSLPSISPSEFNHEHMGDFFRESSTNVPSTDGLQYNFHTGILFGDSTLNKNIPAFQYDTPLPHDVQAHL